MEKTFEYFANTKHAVFYISKQLVLHIDDIEFDRAQSLNYMFSQAYQEGFAEAKYGLLSKLDDFLENEW